MVDQARDLALNGVALEVADGITQKLNGIFWSVRAMVSYVRQNPNCRCGRLMARWREAVVHVGGMPLCHPGGLPRRLRPSGAKPTLRRTLSDRPCP